MMRRVEEGFDTISDDQGQLVLENAKEYFLQHIPEKYVPMCKYIHHVDTQMRGEHWRVQGYISIWDFLNIEKDTKHTNVNMLDCTISIERDAVCIWTLIIPFK